MVDIACLEGLQGGQVRQVQDPCGLVLERMKQLLEGPQGSWEVYGRIRIKSKGQRR